jgi:hypothetical protein
VGVAAQVARRPVTLTQCDVGPGEVISCLLVALRLLVHTRASLGHWEDGVGVTCYADATINVLCLHPFLTPAKQVLVTRYLLSASQNGVVLHDWEEKEY